MQNSSNGHALGEYALLLGLLGAVAISGLRLTGFSLDNLLGASTQAPTQNQLKDYYDKTLGIQLTLTSNGGSQAGNVFTAGSNGMELPKSTLRSLSNMEQVGSASPVSVNVSSVDGNNQTTLGTLRLAQYFDELAQQETDPVKKSYYAQLAELAYYMGANEGELDDFDSYSKGSAYSNADAFNDLMAKQAEFKALLANPPAGLNPQDLAKVTPVAAEVNQIASNYKTALQSLIGANGKINSEFIISDASKSTATRIKTCAVFSCQDLTLIPNFSRVAVKNTTYDNLVPYDQLKAQVNTTLAKYPLPTTDPPVITTFQGATVTNSQTP